MHDTEASFDRPIDLLTKDPADREQIALRGLAVHTTLAAMGEHTTVAQTFANRGQRPVEPIYTFPLPANAAVCGFEVVTNDRVLTGEVDTIERAQEQYEDAVARGDGAYLLERERDDVFTVRVGQLLPNQVATVRIEYVRELEVVDRQVRFELPTTLAPRFVDGTGMDPCDAQLEGDAVNPPKSHAVPYGLSFTCDIDLDRGVNVTSPTHAITVEDRTEANDPHARRVQLGDAAVRPDRAIVLQLELAGDDAPSAQRGIGPSPDGGDTVATYLSVSFLPELETAPQQAAPADIAFLVDCSGSMGGESIDRARRALDLCLRTLRSGDSFQIIRFGSSFEALSDEPLRYDAQSFERGLRDLGRVRADMGGTQLLDALRSVLTTQSGSYAGRRDVVLLTDGQVSNEEAVIALAKQHAKTHRIFTFGIGPAYSDTLVSGLARVTGGAVERIAYGERIEDKVLRTFGRLGSPRVEDLRLEWHGGAAPLLAGDEAAHAAVFDGDAVTFRACCEGGEVPRAVTMHCKVGDEPQSFRIEIPAEPMAGSPAATLWARERMHDLGDALAGGGPTSRFTKQRQDRRTRDLERLGKRFRLVSAATSFFAIEHRTPAERASGEPELQRIPTQMPVGWGGIEAHASGIAQPMAAQMDFACGAPAPASPARSVSAKRSRSGGLIGSIGESISGMFRGAAPIRDDLDDFADEEATMAPDAATDDLLELLGRQAFDGSFQLPNGQPDTELAARLDACALLEGVPQEVRETVRATLAALALLTRDHAGRKATWRLAAAKAFGFLRTAAGCEEATLQTTVDELAC